MGKKLDTIDLFKIGIALAVFGLLVFKLVKRY